MCRKSFEGNDRRYWSYAYNKIFKKIGASSFSFQVDPSGTFLGGSSAYMTPRDWARFGQLYLQACAATCRTLTAVPLAPSCSEPQTGHTTLKLDHMST